MTISICEGFPFAFLVTDGLLLFLPVSSSAVKRLLRRSAQEKNALTRDFAFNADVLFYVHIQVNYDADLSYAVAIEPVVGSNLPADDQPCRQQSGWKAGRQVAIRQAAATPTRSRADYHAWSVSDDDAAFISTGAWAAFSVECARSYRPAIAPLTGSERSLNSLIKSSRPSKHAS